MAPPRSKAIRWPSRDQLALAGHGAGLPSWHCGPTWVWSVPSAFAVARPNGVVAPTSPCMNASRPGLPPNEAWAGAAAIRARAMARKWGAQAHAPSTTGARPSCARSADRPRGYVARVLRLAKREPSAVLLAAQLLGVLVYPFMEGSVGRSLFSVFGIAVLGLVLLAVRSSPAWTGFGLVLAVPATVLLLVQVVTATTRCCPGRRRSRRSCTSTPPAR